MGESVEHFAARLADRIDQFQARPSKDRTLGNFLNAFKGELRVVQEPPSPGPAPEPVPVPVPPPPEPVPVPAPVPPPPSGDFRWSVFDQKIPAGVAIDPDSAAVVANLAKQQFMVQHRGYTTPIYYATASTPRVDIKGTQYAQAGRTLKNVPLDPAWRPAPGGDIHMCVVWEEAGELVEWDAWVFDPTNRTAGTMNTARIGKFDGFRPNGQGQRNGQSALTAGLILRKEAEAGLIPHALTFACMYRVDWGATAPCPLAAGASTPRKSGYIPNGARIRLDPAVNLDSYKSNVTQWAVLRALQDYGAFLVDGGGFGFYAEAEISAGKWRDFQSQPGEWFLPGALKSKLQVLAYGAMGRHKQGPFNQPEHVPTCPIV